MKAVGHRLIPDPVLGAELLFAQRANGAKDKRTFRIILWKNTLLEPPVKIALGKPDYFDFGQYHSRNATPQVWSEGNHTRFDSFISYQRRGARCGYSSPRF